MQHSMTKRRTFIFACFGIAIGLCIGTVLKNYRALEIVKRCRLKPNTQKDALDIIGMRSDETIKNSQSNLVFVGVMTAKNFIERRARTVYDTWGRQVPGRIAFFSSEGSTSNTIPIIPLKNVDDRYPPQKKSFMMLYYMYEHYIDKFEWFIRADDDVYIETQKLERFLRSIDSSKPQFIGQAGKGNNEEFGLLSLEFDENFCMGGPGVILSRETLRRVAPHIPTCLKNLYSTHEDVEVGRCVQKFAGIPCTWNYEMQHILRHNSSGHNAYTGKLKRKEIHSAISLHPIKQAPLMYRLHSYIQGLNAEELRQETLMLHRDISQMIKYLKLSADDSFLAPGIKLMPQLANNTQSFQDHNILGINPQLNKYTMSRLDDLLEWSFLAHSVYSLQHANPKHKIDSAMKEGLADVITEVMENINNYSRQRGRIIEFRELLYGYTRLNHVYGQDFILDLLLIYKKYRGKKMTVPVRRHLYVQRAFTGAFVKSTEENFQKAAQQDDFSPNFLDRGLKKLADRFLTKTRKSSNENLQRQEKKARIVFVLPLAGRLRQFQRFLSTFEEIAIKEDRNTRLLVVLFSGAANDTEEHLRLIADFQERNVNTTVNYLYNEGEFSRGLALDKASHSSFIEKNDIILFIDVDMTFTTESLHRIRLNTICGEQVYLPIVFSQYDTKRTPTSSENGYFRQYGFGICAICKSDILDEEINGFDKNIIGWGLEDVLFLDRIIKVSQRQNILLQNTATDTSTANARNSTSTGRVRKLRIFRAPDPSLIHIYHDIHCDVKLEAHQYQMCLGTKANSLGSTKYIENLLYNNAEMIDYIEKVNTRAQHTLQS